MKSRLQTVIVGVVMALLPWCASVVLAEQAMYAFGAVLGGVVRTDASRIHFEEASSHSLLPNSVIAVDLQPGDNDFFVLEFDAACRLKGDPSDYLSLEARLNGAVGGVLGGSFLQPQNNPTDFHACSSGDKWQTVSKSWVIRLANTTSLLQQRHTFAIWVRVVDADGPSGPYAVLDNRMVRLTRYN
jgi:hypothetical protein